MPNTPIPPRPRRDRAASMAIWSAPVLAAQACTGTTRVSTMPVTAAAARDHHFTAADMRPIVTYPGKA